MRDAALDWLHEHDPESVGISGREYARRIGIITPQVESDIRAHEQASGGLDLPPSHSPDRPLHCLACWQRYATSEHAVE